MSATLNGVPFDETGWTTPVFSAGNFVGVGGTWTVDSGDITFFKYKILGKTLFVRALIQTSTTASAPIALRINVATMAGQTMVVSGAMSVGVYGNAGVYEPIFMSNAGTYIAFSRFPGGATDFADGTDDQEISFTYIAELL